MESIKKERLEEKAKEKKREYFRRYREKNREKLNEYQRKWRQENKDKVKEYNENYWIGKAEEELREG